MKVFYDKKQNAKNSEAFSPSASKPAKVLESWQKMGLPIEVVGFEPCTREQIGLAHNTKYVRNVLDCEISNGFGNRDKEVAKSLPYTNGSFLAAARHAARTGEVSCSLTSGFHHACYNNGGGFCTFNGLIVAAQMLHLEGDATCVGILDLDQHAGNGTKDIINQLELDYVSHWSLGYSDVNLGNGDKWLDGLADLIKKEFLHCDVLLVQFGADPHICDPLGGRLSTEQMLRRDQIVFQTCKDLGIPVAWNLAGGYQTPIRKVLNLHDNTAIACVDIFGQGTDSEYHEADADEQKRIDRGSLWYDDEEILDDVELDDDLSA